MRKLKYPAIYKHFKDKFYATMGVSTYIDIDAFKEILDQNNVSIFKLPKMNVNFTEADEKILCVKYEDKWYHFDFCEENLVLYKSLYDNEGAYGRPEEMFLSEVDREKYPNVSQRYRFEEFIDKK